MGLDVDASVKDLKFFFLWLVEKALQFLFLTVVYYLEDHVHCKLNLICISSLPPKPR